MLRKLRIKFVALTMAAVALILAVVFSIICILNYQQNTNAVYSTLNSTLSFTQDKHHSSQKDSSGDQSNGQTWSKDTDQNDDNPAPPEIGGTREDKNAVIPVAVYSIQDGSASVAVESKFATASIATDVLNEAVSRLEYIEQGQGKIDDLDLFYKKVEQNGTTYIAFADGSTANGWQFLALSLAGVGLLTLLVFFVISLFFSRWALRPVAQAWKQQQQFVADASHELKTPLTVVLANVSILRAHPESKISEQNQWIESTQLEAERMQTLVNDMLLLARSDAEKANQEQDNKKLPKVLDPAPSSESVLVDFSYVVEGQILQFESVAFEKNISLEADIKPDISVLGKQDQLERLVSILLDNACKYASENTLVRISLSQNDKQLCFSINNQGNLIEASDIPHLFDRFYRADKARVRTGGFGLGLAIAKDIVEGLGGDISAKSTEEDGTTFTVYLAVAKL